MQDLAVAFGLMLVIEGALYALFPELMRRAIATVLTMDELHIRIGAVATAALGLLVTWLARG
ncbi:MAG: DUF2065 domain-containing protein [Alphaproteobacteria bacterium]|nr:DUF2065 domain-containing protein [Alphaproteobacteria bacterium]MBF0249666.1 DUF2065 domain-containing protein [Alphaproteobacteria bacterium]